jgi:predicted acyl esterase
MIRNSTRPNVRGATLLFVAAVAVVPITSCTSDGDGTTTERESTDTTIGDTTIGDEIPANDSSEPTVQTTGAPSTLPPVIDLNVRPGVEQLAVVDAEPGVEISVSIGPLSLGDVVATGTVDQLGSLLFRDLDEPAKYYLSTDDGSTADWYAPLERDDHPEPDFYAAQTLPAPGFGYIETRDGTTLSANITLPGPPEDGPYPTVVEYSGYTPSNPDESGFKDLFTTLGYAYVGVNMRGTGCSGGSFDYFEYVQSLDGYDAVEAIAAQPWVLDNEVGMVGISYPGISQLFVAQTQPPSLVAITPLSVIEDTFSSTLYPGGILNTGFAVAWAQDRADQGQPEGQEWAANRIAAGDTECEDNQQLRLQNPDPTAMILDHPFYDPEIGDELAPRLFVDEIEVPTFLAGAWQDEQTGGRFPTMLDQFTGTEHFYASLVNGLHTESIGPGVFPRYVEFLDLYVGKRTPSLDAARLVAPVLAGGIFGIDVVELPPDRFAGVTYEDALAAFESEPPINVLFEEGAADEQPALAPLPRFVEQFDAWPIPGTELTRWFLAEDGALAADAPSDNARTEYTADPTGIPATFYDGNSSDLWRTDVVWDWQEPIAGTAASFVSPPLDETLVMVGSASADLWIKADVGDTDIEVTLTEVRPDGQEVYVQSGWLRASHRALDETASTEQRPVHTHSEADAEPLPTGSDDAGFALARVEIFPFAHVFRPGSQVRISIDAPGGNRAVWEFDTIADGEIVQIGLGGDFPSSIVLPVIAGIDAPAAYPECGSLRGQPCRTAVLPAPGS